MVVLILVSKSKTKVEMTAGTNSSKKSNRELPLEDPLHTYKNKKHHSIF
jgi:hypothetical protein